MRQIVAILLLMIYSVCSTGATIYLHQCGKNTAISVLDDQLVSHENCPMCTDHQRTQQEKEQHHSACEDQNSCNDVQIELKNDIEQLQSKSIYGNLFNFSPSVVLLPWIIDYFETSILMETPKLIPYKSSLLTDIDSIFLLNCTFII